MIKHALMGVSGDAGMSEARENGSQIFADSYTMIGHKRLCQLESAVRDVVASGITGDLIETGVWRGGAVIYMKYLLNELGSDKKVFVADSFEGLPSPDAEQYPADKESNFHEITCLCISEAEVSANFKMFNLLDDRVVFVKGWFKDTLPELPGPFSLIRLDGDMYESTINALEALYPKLTPGGYCIIDDYNIASAQLAMVHYRERENIITPITYIDGSGIFWKKE